MRGKLGISELPCEGEGLTERRLGFVKATTLERDHTEQVQRAHAAIAITPAAEPTQRFTGERLGDLHVAQPHRRGGREQPLIGPQRISIRFARPKHSEGIRESAGAN